jgi:hypothetical protein
MRRLALLTALLTTGTAGLAAAQDAPPSSTQVNPASLRGDRWQITLADGTILWDLRLVRLDGDRLVVTLRDSTETVKVGDIDEIRLLKKSEFALGTGGGGAMAALMGADDEIYDFKPLEFGDRLRAVQRLLVHHPPAAAAPKPDTD